MKREVRKKCLVCNKKIINRKGRFCSKKCGNKDWNIRNKEKMEEYSEEFFRRNPKKQKEYYTKWKGTENYKDFLRKKTLKEMTENKLKHKSRRYGYKKRKEKCSRCDSKENLEFHHTSYKKNIGITLCRICHRELHNKLKGGK